MSAIYTAARTALLKANIDFDVDTIHLALAGESFVFDDTHVYLSDVAGLLPVVHQVVSVTGVDAGRVLIADVVFADVGGADNIRALVAYRDTGDPLTSPLICAVDGRADTVPLNVAPNGGDLTFSFNYLVKI